MKAPRRILVIRRRAIGDVLVSMAVPAALKKAFPEASIHLIVDQVAAPVVKGSPHVDQLIVYPRSLIQQGGFLSRAMHYFQWLKRLRSVSYDVVLDLMGTPQTAFWAWMTRSPLRVGRRRRLRTWAYNRVLPKTFDSPRFAGDVFLDWVRALDEEPGPWTPIPIPRDQSLDEQARSTLNRLAPGNGPIVFLNPSATWPAKAWPVPHFAQLARLLADQARAKVFVIWGPGEEGPRDAIVALSNGCARALPPTDLVALAAHLAQGSLLITTDSGPKHIAVSEGLPTLTLFGSTDPRGWQPSDRRHRWITHDVQCRPCDLQVCTVPGHPCLDDLKPEAVLAMAAEMLGSGNQGNPLR